MRIVWETWCCLQSPSCSLLLFGFLLSSLSAGIWQKPQLDRWLTISSLGFFPSSLYTAQWSFYAIKLIIFAPSVQLLSRVRLFVTPWTATRQASLSTTNSWNLLKFMSIESVMPSNHCILCRPLLLPPWILPSIRVFSNESALCIRWPKYWSFSFSITPSNEHPGLISFRMDWLDLLSMFFFFFLTYLFI